MVGRRRRRRRRTESVVTREKKIAVGRKTERYVLSFNIIISFDC